MRIRTAIGLTTFTIGLVGFALAWDSRPEGRPDQHPRIEVIDTVQLGSQELNRIVTAPLSLRNSGGAELVISDITTNCGCAGLEVQIDNEFHAIRGMTLRPGESQDAVLRVRVSGPPGERHVVPLRFRTNDPERTEVTVEFVVDRVIGGLRTDPAAIMFGAVEASRSHVRTVPLLDDSIVARRVTRVLSAEPDRLTVSYVAAPRSADANYGAKVVGQLSVTIAANSPGNINSEVLVFTAEDGERGSRIPVHAQLLGPVEFTPSRAILPRSSSRDRQADARSIQAPCRRDRRKRALVARNSHRHSGAEIMTRCGRRAFSLIETLLVIGIVGVLLGLLLPGVQSSRDSARRVACSSHLRQLGMAAQNYESVHGHLPPGPYFDRRSPDSLLSWFAKLLPYFDQDGLYRESLQACRTEPNATLSPPHRGMTTSIPILTCPADGRLGEPQISSNGVRAAFTDYVGLSVVAPSDRGRIGLPCAFHDVPGLRTSDVRDGSSTTILLAERPPPANFSAGWWYPNLRFQDYVGPNIAMTIGSDFGYFNPTDCASGDWTFSPGRLDNPCDRNHLWSLHRGGANFCFMDGSVRFLSYSARELVVALATINGGEVVELP